MSWLEGHLRYTLPGVVWSGQPSTETKLHALLPLQAEFEATCSALREEHETEVQAARAHNERVWPQVLAAQLAQEELGRVLVSGRNNGLGRLRIAGTCIVRHQTCKLCDGRASCSEPKAEPLGNKSFESTEADVKVSIGANVKVSSGTDVWN